jgi:uncharacterized protein (TIRG00374 family)
MTEAERRRGLAEEERPLDLDLMLDEEEDGAAEAVTAEEEQQVGTLQALLHDRRKLAAGLVLFVAGVAAIYVLFPKIVGLDDALARIDQATWYWVVIALGFNVAAFAAYVALFRGVLGGTARRDDEIRRRLNVKASYEITMAGLAATRIFSAAGAGGLVVTYWALRKAGMPKRRSACRMVAFLVLMYSVYTLALVLFGILLRTGVLPGRDPFGGTIVPAGVAGIVIVVFLAFALIPEDVERRIEQLGRFPRGTRLVAWMSKGPATVAMGVRTAIAFIRHPRGGALALGGALGFWAANIGILWASFEAFGGDVPFAVLVQGFFVGMAANLLPSPAGGAGPVDAGMIAAFVLFSVPEAVVFPGVLMFRVIAFWLPIPPGIVAYFQLRKTVAGWEQENHAPAGYTSQSKVKARTA